MNKLFFKCLIYFSILFLMITLYKCNYLRIPKIHSLSLLLLSIVPLLAGFLADSFSWKKILGSYNHNVKYNECLAGMGLSIFGKYIPGKFWLVVGRASYIAGIYSLPLGHLSSVSLNAQFLLLWCGIATSATGFFYYYGLNKWSGAILALWGVLTILVFSDIAHRIASKILSKVLKKKIVIANLSFSKTFKILFWFILPWIFWSVALYLFTASLVDIKINLIVGLGFPLAATIGVLAIIAPGGIGAREGILTGYFVLTGIPLETAVTISIASRLWFLIGESLFFIVGLMASRTINEKSNE